jgi:nucleoside 2-deoxyribosyltransferase
MKSPKKKRVYCSGPLFCPGEIELMTTIATTLENAGFETFLPHRDGLEPFFMKHANNKLLNSALSQPMNRSLSKSGFALDMVEIIIACDFFLANLNGRVPDDGAVSEIGMAFAAGKPVLIYKDDIRAPLMGFDEPMIMGASCFLETVSQIEDIPTRLQQIETRDFCAAPDDAKRYAASLQPMIKRGKTAIRNVKRFAFLKPKNYF